MDAPRTLRRLKQVGVEILDGAQSFAAPFLGRLVCVAGELSDLGNARAMDEIERRGGIIVSRVGRTTDFLVVGKNPGKSLEMAKQYGVTVIEEPALAALFETT
jgi:NAD-dependent DNA ligase